MAKAVLKEAVSGSKFAVEAVEHSDVAHVTFQKVRMLLATAHIKFMTASVLPPSLPAEELCDCLILSYVSFSTCNTGQCNMAYCKCLTPAHKENVVAQVCALHKTSFDHQLQSMVLQAMRAGLQGTMRIKGLLEMMFEVLSDWIDAFIEDIEEVEGSETGNTTPKGSISPRDSRGKPRSGAAVLCSNPILQWAATHFSPKNSHHIGRDHTLHHSRC